MNNISAPIYTIVGIVLGWSLTQVGLWYKGRKEDNRIRSQVLYNLLEIHHLLSGPIRRISKYPEILIQTLATHIPELATNMVLQEQLGLLLAPVMTNLIKEKFGSDFTEIEKNYKTSIATLAPIDPIIAYYLNGQTSGITFVNVVIEQVINEIGKQITDKAELAKGKEKITVVIEQKVFTNALAEIKLLIIDLSSNIGPLTKWRVRRILKEQIGRAEDNKELSEFLEDVIRSLKKQLAGR